MERLALGLGLLALAVFVGFCVASGLLLAMIAVLPPFRPEDDETMREFIPVAITDVTWGLTSVIVLVVGWRRLLGHREVVPR